MGKRRLSIFNAFVAGACLALTLFSANIFAQDGSDDLKQQIDLLKSEIERLEQKVDNSSSGGSKSEGQGLLNVYAPGLKSLKVGGATRVRFESNHNFDFDDSIGDGREFTLLRTRLNFDAEVNDHIRGFVEIQDNRLFGEEADAHVANPTEFSAGPPLLLTGAGGGTIGNLDRLDVLQSYIDVSLYERDGGDYDSSNISFRIGRWRMNYGGQKVISPLDWLNQGRAWDGVRMRYTQNQWVMPFWMDFFATQLDEDFIDGGRSGEDEDKIFTGIYTHFDWQKGHSVEPYLLYRRSKGNTTLPDGVQAGNGRTNEERTTLGIRAEGKLASIPGLKYAGEFASQFGVIGGDGVENLDIEDAFGFYAEVAYKMKDVMWKPQVGYAFSFASGDDDPTDGEAETFDQMYPLAHAYLGFIDLQGWQNVVSHKFSLSVNPLKKMLAKIDFHLFELENEDDAWYGVGGGPNGGFGAGAITAVDADDEIGEEIDITLKYTFYDRLNVTAGYSHFFAGDLIDDVRGDDDDADWFYLMTSIKF